MGEDRNYKSRGSSKGRRTDRREGYMAGKKMWEGMKFKEGGGSGFKEKHSKRNQEDRRVGRRGSSEGGRTDWGSEGVAKGKGGTEGWRIGRREEYRMDGGRDEEGRESGKRKGAAKGQKGKGGMA